jgi:hypothetical protein
MPEKKDNKPEEKPEYFTVEVEALIPATLKYKVLAKNPEEALELVKKLRPQEPPKFNIAKMKPRLARIYKWGRRTIEHIKRW